MLYPNLLPGISVSFDFHLKTVSVKWFENRKFNSSRIFPKISKEIFVSSAPVSEISLEFLVEWKVLHGVTVLTA